MLTQTSELAIRALLTLVLEKKQGEPTSPRQLANSLECSPSYLAKTLTMLVRAGVVQSVRGARGGVLLSRDPADITLLEIVEACQGLLIANYCLELAPHKEPICSFHRAMNELHSAMTTTLADWTLEDLVQTPYSKERSASAGGCKMLTAGVLPKHVKISRRIDEDE